MSQGEEAISVSWWQYFGSCCNTCYTRKAGISSRPRQKRSSTDKRIVLLGKSRSGKSHALSILAGNESTGGPHNYSATNGTTVSHVSVKDHSISVVEVGGGLSKFWSRAIDSRVDGIWYLMTKEDFETDDFSVLRDFLVSALETLNVRNLPVLITVVGIPSVEGAHGQGLNNVCQGVGLWNQAVVQACPELSKSPLEGCLGVILNQLVK